MKKTTIGLIIVWLLIWAVYGVEWYIHKQAVKQKLLNTEITKVIVNKLRAPKQFLDTQTLLRKKKKEEIDNLEDDIITLYTQIEARKESQNVLKKEVNDIIEPKIRCWREAFYKKLDCKKDFNLYLGN